MQASELILAVAVVGLAALLAAGMIYVLRPLLLRYLLAVPNARSSHSVPTPQGAGVAVILSLLAILAGLWLLGPGGRSEAPLLPVLAGAFGLMLLGLADDKHMLPVSWRFAGQTVAALVMVLGLPQELRLLPDVLPFAVERGLLVFGTVWFVNAINFLDGIDWITVAQAVPVTLAVAALQALGKIPPEIGVLALALLGVMLGFAIFNKHPAQIFLGDAGSLPVGLLLAFLLIFVAGTSLTAALLLGLYTLADTTITLFQRAFRGENIFSAHRSHFYQRAVIAGRTPPQVTARVFLLGVVLAVLAVTAATLDSVLADLLLLSLGATATALLLAWMARGSA